MGDNQTAENIDLEIYEHQLGPDYLIPTNEFRAWTATSATRIDFERCLAEYKTPHSIPTAFRNTVDKFANKKALFVERDGHWHTLTFKEYYDRVVLVAKAFIKLGLRRQKAVSILGFNSPEWFIADLATIFAGGIVTGLYPSSFPNTCQYILENSSSDICLVDDEEQLQKILQVRDKLPQLKAIVQWLGKPTVEGVLSWDDLLTIGKSVPDEVFEKRLKGISINQPCLMVYTSGTTGDAKGAMFNHDNILYSTYQMLVHVGKYRNDERIVSHLPLNHAAAQLLDVYSNIHCGAQIYFARPDAFKGSLMDTIKYARPTRFVTVPRLWEKMYAKLQQTEKELGLMQKIVLMWARWIGWKCTLNRMKGSDEQPLFYNMTQNFVYKKLKEKIGFSESRQFLTGGAPIDPEVLKYFHCMDIPVTEVYGLTECIGVQIYSLDRNFRLGSVGKPFPWTDVTIAHPDPKGNGEIRMRTRNTFMGYLNKEEDTKEIIDENAWLLTGDIGKQDADGYIYITGRIKELVITSGGENIAPVPIEENIKKQLPDLVSNAVVIADKRKFLSVLLTLKTKLDADGYPTEELSASASDWCKQRNCKKADYVRDIIVEDRGNMSDEFRKEIDEAIQRANHSAVSNAAKVQKWKFLPRDFSLLTGELGPTLKLRRHFVVNKYKDLIDKMYDE